MKKLLLPIYTILAVIITIDLVEKAIATPADSLTLIAFAAFFAAIAVLMAKRLLGKLRIF